MIGKVFNYDDVFFRDLVVCTLAEFEDRLGWINRFDAKDVNVTVPVYYSLTGKEDFLLDSFRDDVVGSARKIEINTDTFPRAHITMTGWRFVSSEFANPNIWVRKVVEDKSEIRKKLTKIRAFPIEASFDMSILLNSEIDTFKLSESLMNSLMFYQHMYFDFNFMPIDAVIELPDDHNVTINREQSIDSDDTIRMDLSFNVRTYYPASSEKENIGKPKGAIWSGQIKEAKR